MLVGVRAVNLMEITIDRFQPRLISYYCILVVLAYEIQAITHDTLTSEKHYI